MFSKPCLQKGFIKSLLSMFSKNFSSGWILLVPTLSVLKYLDITLPRHKSSKIEGTGPPLMSNSIQFHCFYFHISIVSKRKPYTQDDIWKGYTFQVISSLLPVSYLIFRKNSQKIDWNRISWQQIFSIFKIRSFRINIYHVSNADLREQSLPVLTFVLLFPCYVMQIIMDLINNSKLSIPVRTGFAAESGQNDENRTFSQKNLFSKFVPQFVRIARVVYI